MTEALFPVQLPAHPIVEKCNRDIHEKLYRLSRKRYVLVSNDSQRVMTRNEALEWLKSRGMSRAIMFS